MRVSKPHMAHNMYVCMSIYFKEFFKSYNFKLCAKRPQLICNKTISESYELDICINSN